MSSLPEDLHDRLVATAHRLADAARGPALAHFRSDGLTAENKAEPGRFDPVTLADRETEAAIRAVLATERPEDGVLGEEEEALAGSSGLTWVIDPIDGTRAYLIGAPTWGVLIALNDGVRPVIGVVDQPFVGERFWSDGRTARWERGGETREIQTRSGVLLADALLCTTMPEIGTAEERHLFERVRDRVRLTRYGLDCTAYALLACGHVDLVIEAGLHAFDVQALMPVIETAGGVITTWSGGDPQHGGRILAAGSAALHAEAMALLAG
jgi:histidinol phosphatase-like enzyme (inositol monophosphatase family)